MLPIWGHTFSYLNFTILIGTCSKMCHMSQVCPSCCGRCCCWCCCWWCCCFFASLFSRRSMRRREGKRERAQHSKSNDHPHLHHYHSHGRQTINGKEFEDLNIICKLSICKERHNQQNEGKLFKHFRAWLKHFLFWQHIHFKNKCEYCILKIV